jgi:GTP-binding protein YchF
MKIGIIGLPESGKSTLFNVLTGLNVQLHSYESRDKIKPNIGVAIVPDKRLDQLSEIFKPKKTSYIHINFLDIIGIEKGSKLEEIAFAPIKDTDGLICVIRFFEDDNIPHPSGKIDGVSDLKVIETELMLLDLQSAQKRTEKIEKEKNKGIKVDTKELEVLKKCEDSLSREIPLRALSFAKEEDKLIRGFQFLSKKPILIAANIGENRIGQKLPEAFKGLCEEKGFKSIDLCAKVEVEVCQIEDEELKDSFLGDLGIKELAREKVIALSFDILEQITFYTVKGDEAKAWLVKEGTSAYEAAGKIHSDIQRGFIKAEVVNFSDFIDCGSTMQDARDKGKLRLEGKDYLVQDGDIINFKFNI